MRSNLNNITRLKRLNDEYIKIFDREGIILTDESKSRMKDCGTYLSYWCRETPTGYERIKLHKANFCRERFCPMCASRKSSKESYILSQVCDKLKLKGYYFSFITLTIKSLPLYHAKNLVDNLFKSFDLFRHRKNFSQRYDGFFRTLEFTFHRDSTGLIWVHPHIHIIACYKHEYRRNGKGFYPQKDLVNDWRSCLKLSADEPCICDIRDIKIDKKHKSLQEVCKYCFDFSDVLDIFKIATIHEINDIITLVRSRNTYHYGGIFNRLKKLLTNSFSEDDFDVDVPDDAVLIYYEYDKSIQSYVISTKNVYLSNSIYDSRPFCLIDIRMNC